MMHRSTAREEPSHRNRQHAQQNLVQSCGFRDMQVDTQTEILIGILCTPHEGKVAKTGAYV